VTANRPAKRIAFAFASVAVSPLIALSWLERRLAAGEQGFLFGAQCVALLPGLPGAYLRAAYYAAVLDRCDWEVRIGFGSLFVKRAASMGTRASMGSYCVIGNADIGKGTMIGSRVSIPSGRRQHFDEDGRLSANEGRFDRVSIGSGTWIGEGAIVMADVGDDCIVAAGTVVGQSVPARSLVAGNPGRVVRSVRVAADDMECT
jgi:acetyltransferase-like isoleucine patch superfamily enzyme